MTDKEILTKAIDKAICNGYEYQYKIVTPFEILQEGRKMRALAHFIIFSHSFAKAFWGENIVDTEVYLDGDGNRHLKDSMRFYPAWQYHLTNMILEKNPIKYLEKFL